jgi:hypothetical protein
MPSWKYTNLEVHCTVYFISYDLKPTPTCLGLKGLIIVVFLVSWIA